MQVRKKKIPQRQTGGWRHRVWGHRAWLQKVFLHHCRKRKTDDTQISMIKQHIKSGSIIKKDCWNWTRTIFIIDGKPLRTFYKPKFRCSYKHHRFYVESIEITHTIQRYTKKLVQQSLFTLLYSKTITHRFQRPIIVYILQLVIFSSEWNKLSD